MLESCGRYTGAAASMSATLVGAPSRVPAPWYPPRAVFPGSSALLEVVWHVNS